MAEPTSGKAAARVEAQRERILCAAQLSFVEHGFHAASIASIAEKAGMSAGLIYRYFENKNAIIAAIIQRQLDLLHEDVALERRVDLAEELANRFAPATDDRGHGMSPALLLEMSAEATRDPQVAAALRGFDMALRGALVEWMTRPLDDGGHGLPADVAPQRALLLQCLYEGLKVRAVREPELDRDLLKAALRDIVPQILRR